MEVTYCKKCHQKKHLKNYDVANAEISRIVKTDVSDKCMSVCGIAEKKHVIEIDYEYLEANTYDELIDLLKVKYDS